MKKIKLILGFIILVNSVCKSQTVSLVAESKNNLCLLNHEVIESSSFTAFTTEKISKAIITPDAYPEAVFVANNLSKLLIAANLNSFTSPQYYNFQTVLSHQKLNFGNAVATDLNADGLDDVAASNSYGDVYLCRRIFPALFHIDTIPLTLTSGGHHARLYLTNMNNDALPELLTVGAFTANPFGYHFGLYTNNSTTISTSLSFTALNSGVVASTTFVPNDNFSACVADLNNNGKDEVLFVSDATNGFITILYSSISGNLDLNTSFNLGVPNLVNKKIMYIDINSDGQKEVVLYGIVNSSVNFIYVYSANFSGNIPVAPTLQKIISLPGPISDFDFADMNKDTIPDLVTSVVNSGDINVLIAKDFSFNFNNAPITFSQPLHTNGGLALFDTDDNKRTDVLSFAYPTNTVSSISILKNYTYKDSLYAIPNKSVLCQGESVELLTNLKDYAGLGYYSSYSPTSMVQAASHTAIINSAGIYSTSATYSTFLTFPGYPIASTSCIVTSNTIQIRMGITPTITISSPTSLCIGQSATISANGATSFTWSTGDINTPFIVETPTTLVVYTVIGKSIDGCIGYSIGDTVHIHTSANANITSDKTLLCRNEIATFIASGGQTYLWSTGQTSPTISITQTVTVPQTYTVLVDAGGGCIKVASVQTVFNDKCNEVVIKNGITPNGDGSNDFLYIENIERYPNNQVNIFNRWGAELFSSKGYDNDTNVWPNASVKLSPGTYYYVVDLGNGDPVRKGWLEILSN